MAQTNIRLKTVTKSEPDQAKLGQKSEQRISNQKTISDVMESKGGDQNQKHDTQVKAKLKAKTIDKSTKSGKPPKETQIEKKKVKAEQKEDIKPKKKTKPGPQRFDKAFGASFGLIAILSLLVFIPVLGPIMELSFIPYLACNRGCRFVNKKNGMQVGLLVGIVWSLVEVILLLQILDQVNLSVAEPGIKSFEDVLIIIAIFFFNILFCVLGGYTGGANYEKRLLEEAEETEETDKIKESNRSDKLEKQKN